MSDYDVLARFCSNYTECTQCATPKLPKKVLHIRDIVAHWGHCPGKIEMKFLIKNRPFLPILKNKSQFMVNNGRIFRYKQQKTVLEVNFIILKTMFSPFSFIFVILELNFFLSVAHWGHEANHKLLKKVLHIGDNVAHQGVAHWGTTGVFEEILYHMRYTVYHIRYIIYRVCHDISLTLMAS